MKVTWSLIVLFVGIATLARALLWEGGQQQNRRVIAANALLGASLMLWATAGLVLWFGQTDWVSPLGKVLLWEMRSLASGFTLGTLVTLLLTRNLLSKSASQPKC